MCKVFNYTFINIVQTMNNFGIEINGNVIFQKDMYAIIGNCDILSHHVRISNAILRR